MTPTHKAKTGAVAPVLLLKRANHDARFHLRAGRFLADRVPTPIVATATR